MNRWVGFGLLLVLFGCSGSTEKPTSAVAQMQAQPPDDQAAVKTLREINGAQATYLQRNRRYALSFDELRDSHLLEQDPSKTANGYGISLHPAADAESYTVVAVPASPAANVKYFYTDKSGVIRVDQGKDATSSSPPIS